ncbi:hypothetical protein BDZ45DRAFT_748417 [Acephala macrosclerotiorum]|nr:hypothetical protein BDZ45DRAFT_748417 [Acephala macrosclerotiorum]
MARNMFLTWPVPVTPCQLHVRDSSSGRSLKQTRRLRLVVVFVDLRLSSIAGWGGGGLRKSRLLLFRLERGFSKVQRLLGPQYVLAILEDQVLLARKVNHREIIVVCWDACMSSVKVDGIERVNESALENERGSSEGRLKIFQKLAKWSGD